MGGFLPFANLIPTLPDFAGEGLRSLTGGATAKERKNYVTDTRKLRKTQYQDLVFSLTEAGLNPILAVGASPGGPGGATSTSYAGHGTSGGVASAAAANRQAGVAEKTSDSKISEALANAGLRRELAGNAVAERTNILQKFTLDQATIDNIRQNTRTALALQNKHEQDAIKAGASAQKLHKDIEMLDRYGPPGQSWEGVLRQLLLPAAEEGASSSKGLFDGMFNQPKAGEKKEDTPRLWSTWKKLKTGEW